MKIKISLRTFIYHYFVIFTGSMFATFVVCYFTDPETQFSINYIWQMALFSLAADLPSLVFYSKKELAPKRWRIRILIHTLLLEIVLMTAGYLIGIYKDFLGGIIIMLAILVVDLFVWFVSFLIDARTAEEINVQLKKRRSKENNNSFLE